MSRKVNNENKSFRGSIVYLTSMEKEALKRAINQYLEDVGGADKNSPFAQFFHEYDEGPLSSAYNKLIK
ncbi:hypothetical protein [Butyrivibrio proteoclasticus]|uniref:hypothetical protein n=1 Tax=Butyrivibrio proteoclasticus TaxID=43305 RepID=UPI0002F26AE5|nr:hypothetical protein [Butyrivibrio proteoclasticus]